MIAIIVSSAILWLVLARVNYLWYRKLFGAEHTGQDRDLAVALGPIGTILLLLMTLTQLYIDLCKTMNKKHGEISNFKLILAVVCIPWIGAGVANYIWYGRFDSKVDYDGMDRDFIALLGPIGTFCLALMFGVDRLLKVRATC